MPPVRRRTSRTVSSCSSWIRPQGPVRLVGDEAGDVVGGDLEVGLEEGHLDVGEEGGEEAPAAAVAAGHRRQLVVEARRARRREAAADAEPAGDDLTALGPAEDPGDRAQAGDAAAGVGPARRARAEVELGEQLDRGRGEEVVGQQRVLDQLAGSGRTRRPRPCPSSRSSAPGSARRAAGGGAGPSLPAPPRARARGFPAPARAAGTCRRSPRPARSP